MEIVEEKKKEVKRDKWGNKLCEPHGNYAYSCNTPPCHGVGICNHNIRRCLCKECGGGGLCEHGVQSSLCVKCGGGSVCEHGRQKHHCMKCMPNTYYACLATHCIHLALKRNQMTCPYDKVLGMPVGKYRTWVEARWTNKDWSWANYGKDWVLDHIEPLSLKADKDLKEPTLNDIVRRLHYSNTQPLGKTENNRKGAKPIIA